MPSVAHLVNLHTLHIQLLHRIDLREINTVRVNIKKTSLTKAVC
jgi:hypothetical protein